MADHYQPDYDLADECSIETPAALKAVSHPTRTSILDMLLERAASITELARALDQPKGSVGHHVSVLHSAGLIRVVRTRKVRAMTEKFYGRTARWIILQGFSDVTFDPARVVTDALGSVDANAAGPRMVTARYARIRERDAAAFREELVALLDRFLSTDRGGETVYAMVAGVFPTTRPFLPDPSGGSAT